jgi:hypothetical protein
MAPISYRRHRFPPVVIQHAVWLYLRFTLSYRDVEELLAERGLDLSCESVRSCWCSNSDRQSPGDCDGAVLDRAIAGISTKWSPGSRASRCICGVPSTTRASLYVDNRVDRGYLVRILNRVGFVPWRRP